MTLEDAYERVLAAPGDVGNGAGVWNTLMTIALKTKRWSKAVGYYNEVSLRETLFGRDLEAFFDGKRDR